MDKTVKRSSLLPLSELFCQTKNSDLSLEFDDYGIFYNPNYSSKHVMNGRNQKIPLTICSTVLDGTFIF